jgi:hypothetical protein
MHNKVYQRRAYVTRRPLLSNIGISSGVVIDCWQVLLLPFIGKTEHADPVSARRLASLSQDLI